jgi:CHC2 zinc finger
MDFNGDRIMSQRDFDNTEKSALRAKIDEAKGRLPMPDLLSRLGLGDHAKKIARCPFPGHEDNHPSFSVFKGEDGFWHYMCFSKCGDGDEIMFLSKLKGLSLSAAMTLYLDMAGFPASSPPKSHEYPKCLGFHVSPEFPVSPVYPVSNGQGIEEELKGLAAGNACTALDTARTRRWKLGQDLKGVQKRIARKLSVRELMLAFDEWYRLSLPLLDSGKTRDWYEAKFLSEYSKVRFATGDGTLATALENVAKLSPDQLPEIPGKSRAPESWHRLAALHRELSALRGKPTHFLAYRDAARVFDGMSHQEAHAITGALETLGVIKIVSKGKSGSNSRKAAEFRYVLPETERGNYCVTGF